MNKLPADRIKLVFEIEEELPNEKFLSFDDEVQEPHFHHVHTASTKKELII